MRFIADLHLHSRYSRATSREMEVESLAHWARKKGISLLGTGDFTHPTYFAELQAKLTPAEPGLYRLKNGEQGVRFILQVEVCNICFRASRGPARRTTPITQRKLRHHLRILSPFSSPPDCAQILTRSWASDRRVPGGVSSQCPVGQPWCARRVLGSRENKCCIDSRNPV